MIAEDLLLLVHDDETGKPVGLISHLEYAMAGALLVDLVLRERVDVTTTEQGKTGRIVVIDDTPTGVDLLDTALRRLDRLAGRKPKDVLLPLTKGGLVKRVLGGLADRGILRRENDRVLGIFPLTRWPAEDSRHEEELKARLRRVLVDGEQPDERTAALIGLMANTVHAKHVVGRDDARVAQRRAREIAKGDWASDALRKATAEIVVAAAIVPAMVGAALS